MHKVQMYGSKLVDGLCVYKGDTPLAFKSRVMTHKPCNNLQLHVLILYVAMCKAHYPCAWYWFFVERSGMISGRVLVFRSRGPWFESHQRHCDMSNTLYRH